MKVKKVYNDEGIKFDSKLELGCYQLLSESGLPFHFQYKYILLEGFKYNGVTIRPITLTVDFYLPDQNIIIDSKGFQREDNKLKWKLLKSQLKEEQPVIYFPKSLKAMQELIQTIKN